MNKHLLNYKNTERVFIKQYNLKIMQADINKWISDVHYLNKNTFLCISVIM